MSEPENEETSSPEGFDKEIQLINSRKYFCSLCARSFETKTLFDIHLVEHMDENIGNRQNFMQYIAMACPECGVTFQVASDLMLHSVNVCSVTPHTCMECNRPIFGTPYLILHLIMYHNYTEEMLREAGFFMDGYFDNLIGSFMTNLSVSESSESPMDLSNTTDNTIFDMVSGFNTTIQYTERNVSSTITKYYACEICSEAFSRKSALDMHKQQHFINFDETQDIINNSENSVTLDEYEFCNPDNNESQNFVSTYSSTVTGEPSNYHRNYHRCEICSKAFSRKCTLDTHRKKHFMNLEETQDIINNSETAITLNEYEFCNPESNESFVSTYSSTVTGEPSNYHRATMQASYVNPGSRIWRKVQSVGKFGSLKSHVTKKRKMRKKKIIAKSGFALQQSSSSKAMLKSSIDNVDITFFKDIKLRSSLKDERTLVPKRIKIMKKSKTANDFKVSGHQSKSSRPTSNSSIGNVDITFFKDIKLRSSLKEAGTLVSKRMKIMKKSKTANNIKVSYYQPNSSRATSNSSIDNVDISLLKEIKMKSSLKEARSIVSKKMEMSRKQNTDTMDVAREHCKQKNSKKPVNTTRKSKYNKKKPKTLHVRIFVCQLCKKSFKDSYKLKRHSLTHTGERPYTCSKCKKAFARNDHLKRHFKRVCSKIEDSN